MKPRGEENMGYGLTGLWFHPALHNGILHGLAYQIQDVCPHQQILCVPTVSGEIILGVTDVDSI